MTLLVGRSLLHLIVVDLYLCRRNFGALYRKVRDYPVKQTNHDEGWIVRVCNAVDIACIWYPKQVLCLQRSAATTCLLRSCGVPAQMVIGTQRLPFKAHAWVEVEGRVVNDKSYRPEMYAVLDRC
jgi:hypothetical protein